MLRKLAAAIVLVTCLGAGASRADLIVYGTLSDHAVVPGGALDDVAMSVNLTVSGGIAVVTFTNVSTSPEITAVFKEIVMDTVDDDTGQAVLWNGVVLTDTNDVGYTIGPSNGLPGYHGVTSDLYPLVELQAKSPPPKMGIGRGESLQVRFNTVLPDGSGIQEYLAFFGGGSDTGQYSIGFHAISATVVGGESLSGITLTPEPGALVLLGTGGLAMVVRRRRRK